MRSLHNLVISIRLISLVSVLALGAAGAGFANEPELQHEAFTVAFDTLPELQLELASNLDRELAARVPELTTRHLDGETESVVERRAAEAPKPAALAAN